MKKPEIRFELEVKFGTSYGSEEAKTLQAVLEADAVDEFQKVVADSFWKSTGIDADLFVARAADGAGTVTG